MGKIVLDLDRGDISVEDFTEAFRAQVRLVTEVMLEMGIGVTGVRWVVSELRYGSTYAAADPQVLGEKVYMTDVDLAIHAAGAGFEALTQTPHRPKFFNDDALKTSARLMQLVSASSAGKARLGFGATSIAPSAIVGAHVDAIIRGSIRSIGSVDGKLIGIAGEDGSYRIAVHDRLRDRKIACSIPEHLLARALNAFNSRVVVRGVLTSRSDGTAIRIEVRDFEQIPPDSELPTGRQVRGLLSGHELADAE